MLRYKNIVWDWNGTIVNDAWVFVDIMNGILAQKGLPLITLKRYRQNFCFPIQDYWHSLGFRFTQKSFDKLNSNFITEYKKVMFFPKLHDGIIPLLKRIHNQGLQQFILSASEASLLRKSVVHYKINDVFTDVLGVNNLNAEGKIKQGEFLFKKYNLKPHETLVIGDTEYDHEVAKYLNCSILLISHGHINHGRLQKTCSRVVSSIIELESFLKNS